MHAALKSDGSMWSWGKCILGQGGANEGNVSYSSPVAVVGNHAFNKISVGIAQYNTAALKANGEVWTWGENSYGGLGDNSITDRSSPVLVVGNHSFTEIACLSDGTRALKANGEAWACGYNGSGELGNNTFNNSYSSPVKVVGNHSFIKINAGGNVTFALKENGEMWGWGYNAWGQLVQGDKALRSSPVLIGGEHTFTSISTGDYNHTVALKANGEAWTWGRNQYGELGRNDLVSTTSPVLVVGNHSFVDARAGYGGTIFLKADGEMWGTGIGWILGDNTTDSKSSPVKVVGNHSFVGIQPWSAVWSAAARKANGEVWAWGINASGDCGDNTLDNRSSPVLVIGNHNFVGLDDDGWILYTAPFDSLGWVKLKIVNPN